MPHILLGQSHATRQVFLQIAENREGGRLTYYLNEDRPKSIQFDEKGGTFELTYEDPEVVSAHLRYQDELVDFFFSEGSEDILIIVTDLDKFPYSVKTMNAFGETPLKRNVYLHLYEDYRAVDKSIQYRVNREDAPPQKLYIQDDRPTYSIPYQAKQLDRIFLQHNGETVEVSLPDGEGDIFVGVPSLSIFPQGVQIMDEQRLREKLKTLHVKLGGELPFVSFGEVELHLPFLPWSSNQTILTSKLTPSEESNGFNYSFDFDLAAPTMGFIHMNEQYFPVLLNPHQHSHIAFDFNWQDGNLAIEWMHSGNEYEERFIDIAAFPNVVWAGKGLDVIEYQNILNGFVKEKGRKQILRSIHKTILDQDDGSEMYQHAIQETVEVLYQLENDPRVNAFTRTYRSLLDQRNHKNWEFRQSIRVFLTIGFLLSLLMLFVTIFARAIRPHSKLSQWFPKVEPIAHLFAFAMLVPEILLYQGNLVRVSTLSNWPMAIGAVCIYVLITFFLVPGLVNREHFKTHKTSIRRLLIILGGMLLVQMLNPFENLYLISWEGSWHWDLMELKDYWIDYLPELQLAILIPAGLYGFARFLLIRRMTQISTHSENLTAELSALKTQISPHFFFNSLNTIYGYSLNENSPKTAEAITKLSDMMRFVIYKGNAEFIPLSDEFDYLSDYVELQKLRLDDKNHDVRFEIEGEPHGKEIAPLMLISLIENAFKHGISNHQPSHIHIQIEAGTDFVQLSIENSNHAITKVLESGTTFQEGGIGLENTRQRLNLLYPNRFEWQIEDLEETYFTRLRIQL
ncbi:MAG: histidine kinase [Bacteroidota bacterium]